jgi:hypothetical protein
LRQPASDADNFADLEFPAAGAAGAVGIGNAILRKYNRCGHRQSDYQQP